MTTATSGRIRRSVRFAQLDSQAQSAGRDIQVRRERMRVTERLEMPSYQNTQDWTSGMGISPSGRFQVIEQPRDRQKIFLKTGIRQDAARTLLWIAAALMCVVLLVSFASIGASSLRIQRLQEKIETAENNGNKLRAELARSGGDITVCTKAVEMNLISSGGAPTIQLTAPLGATMTLMEAPSAEATEEPEMRAALTGTD